MGSPPEIPPLLEGPACQDRARSRTPFKDSVKILLLGNVRPLGFSLRVMMAGGDSP